MENIHVSVNGVKFDSDIFTISSSKTIQDLNLYLNRRRIMYDFCWALTLCWTLWLLSFVKGEENDDTHGKLHDYIYQYLPSDHILIQCLENI